MEAPHATIGINSIQPNIVNKLANKFHNKKQKKQSEMLDDESEESSTVGTGTDEDESSSANTLSGSNESSNESVDENNEMDVLDNDIAEKIGDSGDILTNMMELSLTSIYPIF